LDVFVQQSCLSFHQDNILVSKPKTQSFRTCYLINSSNSLHECCQK
jgi:hypothetical protein